MPERVYGNEFERHPDWLSEYYVWDRYKALWVEIKTLRFVGPTHTWQTYLPKFYYVAYAIHGKAYHATFMSTRDTFLRKDIAQANNKAFLRQRAERKVGTWATQLNDSDEEKGLTDGT